MKLREARRARDWRACESAWGDASDQRAWTTTSPFLPLAGARFLEQISIDVHEIGRHRRTDAVGALVPALGGFHRARRARAAPHAAQAPSLLYEPAASVSGPKA